MGSSSVYANGITFCKQSCNHPAAWSHPFGAHGRIIVQYVPSSYADCVPRVAAKHEKESSVTSGLAQSQPVFRAHGSVGVLLIHGYSGSPAELLPLANELERRNHSVAVPLLRGHGGMPAQLKGVRWQQWEADAETAHSWLSERCRSVFVCGFSMGGLLALRLAARGMVAGAVLPAPALHLFGEQHLRFVGALKYVMPWFSPLARANFADPQVRASVLAHAPGIDLDDPAVVAHVRQQVRIPLDSLAEMVRLQHAARQVLAEVQVPLLLMHGRGDNVVQARSISEIQRQVAAQDVEVRWFERSGHQLLREAEHEAVVRVAADWIDQHASSALQKAHQKEAAF